MTAGFVDLAIKPRSVEDLERIASTARRLGIVGVVVEGAPGFSVPSSVAGVRVFRRVTIRASTRREARRGIDEAPSNAIVVVEAASLDVLRYAGVNKRVDVIRPAPGLEPWAADASQARLFRERGWGAIEYPLRRLLSGGRRTWSLFIAMARRAFSHDIPLVLVSDATSPYDLWHPRVASSLLVVAGIPEDRAVGITVNSPIRVLARRGYAP